MEPESSLPLSQQPVILLYPEADESSPRPHPSLCAILLFPKRATCPAHLIFLDFITRIIFGG
jgi:hypothetical protein